MANAPHSRLLTIAMLCSALSCAPALDPEVPAAPPDANKSQVDAQTVLSVGATPASPLKPGYASFVGEIPVGITSFGAAATPDHVYVLGGYSGEPHNYNREGQSDSFSRLNLQTGVWEQLPSVGKIQSATLDQVGGRLFRVGGMRINNATSEPVDLVTLADVEVFNVATSSWSKCTPLPEARSSHGTAVVNDKLYVIGGWALKGKMDSGTWASTLSVAQTNQDPLVWQSEPVPFQTRALGVAALGQHIFAIGGIEGRRVQRSTHVYDTQAKTWSLGPEFPEPAFGIAVTSMGGRLYASGASGTVYVLNAERTAWDRYSQLTFPRFFHSLVATADERLLFLGGIPGVSSGDRVRHIEQVTANPVPVTSWTFAAPSPAKNRQGAFLDGNGLYVFGGNKALGQHDFAPGNFIQDNYRLDLGSFAWTKEKEFPNAAQSMQAIVTGKGTGVASGGFGPSNGALLARPQVYHYNFKVDTWTEAGAFPEPRTQFGLAEYQDQLWVFGGMNFDNTKKGDSQFMYPTAVLRRNAEAAEPFIDSGVVIPRPRRAFAWSSLGDRFYMIGGMAHGFAPVSECDVYDFAKRAWGQVSCPSRVRIGAEMVALDGKLYLVAGRSKPTPDADLADDGRIEVFDPESQTWSLFLDKLPIADTHQLRVFPFQGKLLIYTAQREDQQVQILVVDPHAVVTAP